MISNCGHDENGKYSGGTAGDQTGKEWQIIKWYSRPWNCVIRHPDPTVRTKIAELARQAANNNNIGYDQSQRTTFWQMLEKYEYDPEKIQEPCEADCSAGVAAIVKAAGYLLDIQELATVNKDCYTGNLRYALSCAGFNVLYDSKYLTGDEYLLPGDILLYEYHHVAVNLDEGQEPDTLVAGMPDLTKGSKGYAVKTLQRLLNALSFNCGEVDGDFGSKTETAVSAFQEANNIYVSYTGTVGSKTWTKLLKG